MTALHTARQREVREALAAHPLLRDCAPAVIDTVLAPGRTEVFEPGAVLIREGDAANYWLLCQGTARAFYRSHAGVEITVKLFAAPAALAEMEVLTGRPHVANCAAVERALLVCIPGPRFLQLLEAQPRFMRNVLQDTAARFYNTAENEKRLAFAPVEERTAHLLLSYARVFGVSVDDGIAIATRLSHAEIANGIGAVQKSVTRTLAQWQRQGLVSKRGSGYVVHDVAALEALSPVPVDGIDFVAGRAHAASDEAPAVQAALTPRRS
jgi:CRP-like cAMP-binding protein